jgi:hypothetical protein
MSILRDKQTREITQFGGAWQLSDGPLVDFRGALKATNLEFTTSQVGTRHGFKATGLSSSYDPGELYCWYGPFSQITSNYSDTNLCFLAPNYTGAGVDLLGIINLKSGGLLYSIAYSGGNARAVGTFVGIGMRLYFCFVDTSQKTSSWSFSGGVIAGYNNSGSFGGKGAAALTLFPGPTSYVPGAPTEPSAGVVTAGAHRLGYIIEYNTGFTSRVSPDTGSSSHIPDITSFAPVSFTSAGAKNLSWVLNPTAWPVGATACSIVMTTTTNPNQYYIVPGSRTAVADGAAGSTTFTINISDTDLASQGIDATPYLYKYTCSNTNAAFVLPRHIVMWGDRMAYHTSLTDSISNSITCIYVSERNDYQTFTADQHLVQLPGQRPSVTSFRMGTLNYVVGPHEIWSVTDTGDVPVSWPAPQLIDGRHGTLAIHGVEVSPSSNYAWIADQNGLYVFTGGPMDQLPISYQQTTDWQRINWDQAWCIKVKDHASAKQVFVMVPLDGATTASHLMMFDYANGVTWDTVRYSLWSLASYPLGAMEIVRNDLASQATGNQKKLELWLGSSSVGAILRQTTDSDTNPFRDASSAIACAYRTAMFPGKGYQPATISRHSGFHTRIKGAGNMTPLIYDMDQVLAQTLATQALASAPAQEIFWGADVIGDLACVEFNTNTLDTHWTLASLKWYLSPYMMQR